MEEEEEGNSKNSGRELWEEKNFDSKRERVSEEKEQSENSVENTWEPFTTDKTHETTHVSASFSLQPITFCEASNKVETSPITISSPAKERTKDFGNPLILQDKNQLLIKNKEVPKMMEQGGMEEEENLEEKDAQMENWIKFLEEGF